MLVRVSVRDGEAVALVRNCELRVAAVDGVAGEERAVAQVLMAREAVPAFAVSPAEPRHANTGARLVSRASLENLADDLMPEHERKLRLGEVAVDDVQVGAAHTARANPKHDLARPGLGVGKRGEP